MAKHSEEVSIYFDFSAETPKIGGILQPSELQIKDQILLPQIEGLLRTLLYSILPHKILVACRIPRSDAFARLRVAR